MQEDWKYIKALAGGDYKAFEVVFRKYSERVYAFIFGLTHGRFAAEELTQIVFLKIWEKREHIDEHLNFKSFLFSVTYHEIISWLRKETSEKRKVSEFLSKSTFLSNDTETEIEVRHLETLINSIVATFPEKRRIVYKMSREAGLSNKEIAGLLDISVKTVESHITQALQSLRERLSALADL